MQKLRSLLPKVLESNSYVTQTEDDELISGECTLEMLHFLQCQGITKVTIGISKRTTSSDTNLDLRTTFYHIESRKYELNDDVTLSPNHLVVSPLPIRILRDIKHTLKDKNINIWKIAIYEQHENSYKLLALSIHFPVPNVTKKYHS